MAVNLDSPHFTICDAGPLIHLAELNCLDLLEGLGSVMIPETVWREVSRHRSNILLGQISGARIVPDEAPRDAELVALCRIMDLDAGEKSALALLQNVKGGLFLTDDAAARLAAEKLGLAARGSIGIIVRSIRRNTRTVAEVHEILQSIPGSSSLYLQRSLLEKVLVQLPGQ